MQYNNAPSVSSLKIDMLTALFKSRFTAQQQVQNFCPAAHITDWEFKKRMK
jgi:hypothetical protein